MIGRIAIRSAVAVAVLYVAVAMAAALARIGPHATDEGVVHTEEFTGTEFDAELYDLRTEDIVP